MSEENIFSEIDEELRSERMRNLWRRYAPYVFGAAVAIVLLVAGNEAWSWYQKSNAARSSDAFYAALELVDDGDIADAQEALNQVSADGSGGYPILVQFRQAALLNEDGKKAEAIAAYDALSTSLSHQRLRELALIMASNLLIDDGDVAGVEARLSGVIAPDNDMRSTAREILGLTQYTAADLEAARATFEQVIADPTGSGDTVSRVQVYLAQLTAEGIVENTADSEAAASETPAE